MFFCFCILLSWVHVAWAHGSPAHASRPSWKYALSAVFRTLESENWWGLHRVPCLSVPVPRSACPKSHPTPDSSTSHLSQGHVCSPVSMTGRSELLLFAPGTTATPFATCFSPLQSLHHLLHDWKLQVPQKSPSVAYTDSPLLGSTIAVPL